MAAAVVAIKNKRRASQNGIEGDEMADVTTTNDLGVPSPSSQPGNSQEPNRSASPDANKGTDAKKTGRRASAVADDIATASIADDPGGDDHLPRQKMVRDLYHRNVTQIAVASLIMTNFVCTIVEKEVDPFPDEVKQFRSLWQTLDQVFTWAFVVELAMNMYGHAWCKFWRSGWNLFDFVIVTISVLSTTGALTGPLGILKTLRAFRVFRLFKRVEALNKIIVALFRSIPGVTNAFIIMVIVMSIYAIIGVEIYSTFGQDGTFYTVQQIGVHPNALYPNSTLSSETMRGFNYGQEYFGTFFRALFTLFQVLTGESWAEVVARPLIFGYDAHSNTSWFFSSFYFASYVILMQIVLVNVVVAVLLDKFVEEKPSEETPEEEEQPAQQSDAVAIKDAAAPPGPPSDRSAAAARPQPPPSPRDGGGVSPADFAQLRSELAVVHKKLDGMAEMQSQLNTLTESISKLVAALPKSEDGKKALVA